MQGAPLIDTAGGEWGWWKNERKTTDFSFPPWTHTSVGVQMCECLSVCMSLPWVPVLSCPGAMEPATCPYPAWTSTCTDWLLICREKEEVERQWLEKAAGGYEWGPNGVLSSETQTESRRAVIHTEHTHGPGTQTVRHDGHTCSTHTIN